MPTLTQSFASCFPHISPIISVVKNVSGYVTIAPATVNPKTLISLPPNKFDVISPKQNIPVNSVKLNVFFFIINSLHPYIFEILSTLSYYELPTSANLLYALFSLTAEFSYSRF